MPGTARATRRALAFAAPVCLLLAAPAPAFDKGRINKCLRPPNFECAGRVIDDAIKEAGEQANKRVREANDKAKEQIQKAETRSKDLQKQLDQARSQAGQAARGLIPNPPPELVRAAACLKQASRSGIFGVPFDKAARHPNEVIRAALNQSIRMQQVLAQAARAAVPRPRSLNITVDDKGFNASMRIQPGRLDVGKFTDALVAGVRAAAAVEPAARCVADLLQTQANMLKRELPPLIHRLEQQMMAQIEPLAAEAIATAINLSVDKIGGLLGDKEAKSIMQGIIAEALIDPAKMQQIAREVGAVADGPAGAQSRPKADAALRTLKSPWEPKPELMVRLARPALVAGAKYASNLVIKETAPYVYDAVMWVLKQSMLPAINIIANELCSIGDVIFTWGCAGVVSAVEAGWDATVSANRTPVSKVASFVASLVMEAAIDQAAKQIEPRAVQAVRENRSHADRFVNAALSRVDRPRLNRFIHNVMTRLVQDYVKRTLTALDAYNKSVAKLVTGYAK